MSTPRKTPRQQRSEFTFDAILDAAARLFQQYGYAATTTNKVAALAGVSIGISITTSPTRTPCCMRWPNVIYSTASKCFSRKPRACGPMSLRWTRLCEG
jgi:hypothetical protein